jgi:hypothetical protein
MALTGGKNLYDDYSQPVKPKKAKKVGFAKAAGEMATTEEILSEPDTIISVDFELAYRRLCDRIHASGDAALLKALEKVVEDYGA